MMIFPFPLTYVLLLLTVCSCFLLRHSVIIYSLLGATSALGLFEGYITALGLAFLALLYALTRLSCTDSSPPFIKHMASISLIAFIVLFWQHCVPGFENILFFNGCVSPASSVYRMYLNLDKTLMGIVLFIASPFIPTRAFYDDMGIQTCCSRRVMGYALDYSRNSFELYSVGL